MKRITQKDKIIKYEALLHTIHAHAQITCNHEKLKHLISNISNWSYAHRTGNGMLSETEQQKLINHAFHGLLDTEKNKMNKNPPNIISISTLKDLLLDILPTDSMIVEFTKVNGDMRRMACTTDIDRIPADLLPTSESNEQLIVNTEKLTTLKVFDVGVNDWRSFRLNSVTRVLHNNCEYLVRGLEHIQSETV